MGNTWKFEFAKKTHGDRAGVGVGWGVGGERGGVGSGGEVGRKICSIWQIYTSCFLIDMKLISKLLEILFTAKLIMFPSSSSTFHVFQILTFEKIWKRKTKVRNSKMEATVSEISKILKMSDSQI